MRYFNLKSGGARHSGFTLMELAVVVVIVGLVLAMGMSAGVGALETARISQTEKKMQAIENALTAMRTNKSSERLPCPADASVTPGSSSYGVEAANPGSCTGGSPAANYTSGSVVEGAVPVHTLNLPDDFMYDGWGRKFVYAVDANATDYQSFQSMGIDSNCSITVNDASGNARTTGAMYVLASLGPNGHGGYTKAGARNNAGVTNTDEQTNCHCNASGASTGYSATYVQEDPVLTGAVGQFDDIVRYKMRWQMLNRDDENVFAAQSSYRGPDLMVGYASSSSSGHIYKLNCGRLLKQTNLSPVPANNAVGVGFNVTNSELFVFSAQAGNACYLYPITNGTPGAGGTFNTCPTHNASIVTSISGVSSTTDSYLAITDTSSPYIHVWKIASNGTATALTMPGTPVLGSMPTSVSITENYLLLSNSSYVYLYARGNTVYSPLTNRPDSTELPAAAYSSTISPDEKYIAITQNSTPAKLYLWSLDDGNTTQLASSPITMTGVDTPAGVTFSPDGGYLAVGGGATSGDNVIIYRIDSGTFTRLSTPSSWSNSTSNAGKVFAFSHDSQYLVMGTSNAALPVAIFRQTGAQGYRYAGAPDSVPAAAAKSVAFRN